MNLATLRVEGTDEALQAMRDLLGIEPNQTWKKGEPKRRGGCFSHSGLSATIADEDAQNPVEMIGAIREFVSNCKERNFVFSAPSLSAEIAIGVTVGDSVQFVAFVDFSAADLLALGALGVDLSIAAYPTSDEANANDQDA